MYLNYRGILRVMTVLCMILGIAMLPALLVSTIYSETTVALSFAMVSLVLILIGVIIWHNFKPSPIPFTIRDGFLIVSLSWIFISVVGSLPYIISGAIPNFVDALFESVSGFTTTGASLLTDVEALPKGLLFWRALSQWLGGIGVIMLVVALLPALGFEGQTIAKIELTGPVLTKATPKITDAARILYIIYIIFTLLETFLLLLGGMNLFDSVTHAFTTMSTGGFTNYNDNIAHFNSAYIECVVIVFMFLAGINFNLYFFAVSHKPSELLKDAEFGAYAIIALVSSVILAVFLYASNIFGTIGESVRQGVFHTVSILSTTGFAISDFSIWPSFAATILFLLMFIGGCSSSPAGGIKVIRVYACLKLVKRGLLRRLHPNAIMQVKLRDKVMDVDDVLSIASFIFFYTILICGASVLIAFDGHDMTTCITAASSCLSNIGIGLGKVSPALNYDIFSSPIKLLLSFLMIAGRLELFTLFMMLSHRFWNPNH